MIQTYATIALALLSAALVLSMARLWRGPTVPDRVAGLDLAATLVVGILAVYSIVAGTSVFLDPAFVLALIAFLGTVSFAKYLEVRR